MMPIIILGGIYGGIFTATEAASVCAVLAILLGIFVYRRLKAKNTLNMLRSTASSIGSIFMPVTESGNDTASDSTDARKCIPWVYR